MPRLKQEKRGIEKPPEFEFESVVYKGNRSHRRFRLKYNVWIHGQLLEKRLVYFEKKIALVRFEPIPLCL